MAEASESPFVGGFDVCSLIGWGGAVFLVVLAILKLETNKSVFEATRLKYYRTSRLTSRRESCRRCLRSAFVCLFLDGQ